MRWMIPVLLVGSLAACGPGGKHSGNYLQTRPNDLYSVDFRSTCTDNRPRKDVSDIASYFGSKINRMESETSEVYKERVRTSIPDYVTLDIPLTYITYQKETHILRAPALASTYPLLTPSVQPSGINSLPRSFNPLGDSSVIVEISKVFSHQRTTMGVTAYGYRTEIITGRQDQYLVAIGQLYSKNGLADRYHLSGYVSIYPAEMEQVGKNLNLRITIKTAPPYLMRLQKSVSSATIADPVAIATFKHVLIGDLCSARILEPLSGKEYPLTLKFEPF